MHTTGSSIPTAMENAQHHRGYGVSPLANTAMCVIFSAMSDSQ